MNKIVTIIALVLATSSIATNADAYYWYAHSPETTTVKSYNSDFGAPVANKKTKDLDFYYVAPQGSPDTVTYQQYIANPQAAANTPNAQAQYQAVYPNYYYYY